MLSDILKVLEILINSVKSVKFDDQSRRRFAKQILKIYLDIEKITQRGKDILSFMDTETDLVHINAFYKLQNQMQAIENLLDNLKDESIKDILKVHLPEFNDIEVLLRRKGSGVGLVFSQLLKCKPHHSASLFGKSMLKVPSNFELSRKGKEALEYFKEFILLLPYYRIRNLSGKTAFFVFSTREQFQEVSEVLNQIMALEEQLRLFLIEKFKIEDLI